jgi:hypothetical protein
MNTRLETCNKKEKQKSLSIDIGDLSIKNCQRNRNITNIVSFNLMEMNLSLFRIDENYKHLMKFL